MSRPYLLATLALLCAGALGGVLAAWAHLPLPYMMGAMLGTAVSSLIWRHKFPAGYSFPQKFRLVFLAIIGVMIGAQVSPELVQMVPALAASFAAIVLFVGLAHGGNYLIFRRFGRYDRATAFYSGAPGGLMESIALGEAAGANLAILTTQQFLRIILVITLVPIGLSLWVGAPVGSAGGMSLAHASPDDLSHLHVVIFTALVGLALGRPLRLPAWQLTGPLFAAAVVSVLGLGLLDLPDWVINICQVVIGTSLGMRLGGLRGRMVVTALGMAVISVGFMLALGLGFAAALTRWTGTDFDVLLVSFAPGGVTEMALVALSLSANPAVVTAHHIWRIILTVLEIGVVGRYVERRGL